MKRNRQHKKAIVGPTEGVLQCGYTPEIQSILDNHTPGRKITNQQAELIYPFFKNFVDMVYATSITSTGISSSEARDIKTEALVDLMTRTFPVFDPQKYPGKSINYFKQCIWNRLVYLVNKTNTDKNSFVSIDDTRIDANNTIDQDEHNWHFHPQWETGNENQDRLRETEMKEELLRDMIRWFSEQKPKFGAEAHERKVKLLRVTLKILNKNHLDRIDQTNGHKGKMKLYNRINKALGMTVKDEPQIGSLLRRLFCRYVREVHNIRINISGSQKLIGKLTQQILAKKQAEIEESGECRTCIEGKKS